MRIASWLAMLALLPATAGAAPAINLFWNDCGYGGGASNLNDACTMSFGPPHKLVVSIVADDPITGVTAAHGAVDIQFDAAVTPDYWMMQPGGVRAGAVLIDPFIGSANGPYSCDEPWSQVGEQVGAVEYTLGSHPNRVRIYWSVTVPAPVTIGPPEGVDWYLAALNFLRPGTTTATGCTTPACFTFGQVVLARAAGDLTVCTPALAQHVTWQGGGTVNCPPFQHWVECPIATPVQENTWGQIKQLYR